jgi:hypothetical protein
VVPPRSGGARRILLEHSPAARGQLRLFPHEAGHDAVDARDFARTEPEDVADARHLLILGPTIFSTLLRAGGCRSNCNQDHDRRTPHTQPCPDTHRQSLRRYLISVPHDGPFWCLGPIDEL